MRVRKPKSIPTTIKRGSSQGEKTHRVSEHSNTHLKPENYPLGNSFFSSIIFYSLLSSLLLHQFIITPLSIRPLISKTTMNFCMRWAFQAQRKRRNGLVKGGRGNDLLKEAVICSSLFNLHTFMLFKILYNIFLTPNFLHGTPSP